MYGIDAGMIAGAVLIGLAIFAVMVIFVRWLFGIDKIIVLLTAIEKKMGGEVASQGTSESPIGKPAPRPED